MPIPYQRGRGTWTARIKIPPDLRDVYARQFKVRWAIKKSWPRNLSPAEANKACADWVDQVTKRFDALRAATAGRLQTLNHRETHALVGRWYFEFISEHESDPGPEIRYEVALDHFEDRLRLADSEGDRDADALLADPEVLAACRDDVAEATAADKWLLDHGFALAPESRARFLDALAPRYVAACVLLMRRSRGDYGNDLIAETFPTLDIGPAKDTVSIRAVFEQWIATKKPAAGTIGRWRPVVDAAENRWPDWRKVTDNDARAWLKSCVTADRSIYTVNETWRTALKTLGNFAVREGVLKRNPFTIGKLDAPRKIETRESKAFTDAEAKTILAAALASDDAAKRWLPWLCAYSGARAGEIAQLRGQDIVERDGIWAMVLTPDAGTMKTRKPRTIPVHSHLIEQSFLDFVRAKGEDPLFGSLSGHGVAAVIGRWVRSIGISDPEISPNHAWRHRFKLIAERAGIPERLSDVITGHAPASVGRAYGAPELSDLAREIAKFPRYEV